MRVSFGNFFRNLHIHSKDYTTNQTTKKVIALAAAIFASLTFLALLHPSIGVLLSTVAIFTALRYRVIKHMEDERRRDGERNVSPGMRESLPPLSRTRREHPYIRNAPVGTEEISSSTTQISQRHQQHAPVGTEEISIPPPIQPSRNAPVGNRR